MKSSWFPRLLYYLSLMAAAALILLVILSPLVDNKVSLRWLTVFANDPTLRRTAVASALGLVVTACVFFRTPGSGRQKSSGSSQAPPSDMAGA